jgi:hypothetical protein
MSVDGSCLLSGVGCLLLTVDSKLSLSVVDVGSWFTGVYAVDRLCFPFIGAQLCLYEYCGKCNP